MRITKQKLEISLSEVLSILAIIISIIGIYFSIFYENHDLSVSMIDSNVQYSGSNLEVDLLYHNHGNTHATVIQDYLVFYQKSDWENEGVLFDKGRHVYELKYNPAILIPGEQILRKVITQTSFDKIDTTHRKLILDEDIRVGLVSTYINQHGLKTREMFPIGKVTLDRNGKIIKYNLNYNVFNLNSNSHFVGVRLD